MSFKKPKIPAQVVFNLTPEQEEIVMDLVNKMINHTQGAMIVGNLVRRQDVCGDFVINAGFSLIDYETAVMLKDLVDSREKEIKNA